MALLSANVNSFSRLIYDNDNKIGANLISNSLIDENNNCCIIGLLCKFFLNMSNEELKECKYEDVLISLGNYFTMNEQVFANLVHANDEFEDDRDILIKKAFDRMVKSVIFKRENYKG